MGSGVAVLYVTRPPGPPCHVVPRAQGREGATPALCPRLPEVGQVTGVGTRLHCCNAACPFFLLNLGFLSCKMGRMLCLHRQSA